MEAPIGAALIVAFGAMGGSLIATIMNMRAQHRLAWYAERRPHYLALVEAAARSQTVQSDVAELLRSGSIPQILIKQRQILRETRESASDLRRALFAVQLIATPPVFEAADRMLTRVAAGAAVLQRVTEDKATWASSAAQLDHLEEELHDARDDFVARAREELGLGALGPRVSSSAAVEDLIDALEEGRDPARNID